MKSRNILTCILIAIVLMGFEVNDVIPFGWLKTGTSPKMYTMGIDKKVYKEGANSAYIESREDKIEGFSTLMQSCSAKDFLGKKIRMTGYLKSEKVMGWTGLWLRIDGKGKSKPLGFDNMYDRHISGTSDWTKCEIVMDVPPNSSTLNFGALLSGSGKIWFDHIVFEEVNPSDNTNSKSNEFRGPVNTNFEKY